MDQSVIKLIKIPLCLNAVTLRQFEIVANNCFEQGCLCLTQKESLLTTSVHVNHYKSLT